MAATQLPSAGHSGAFTGRTILEQRQTEIPEEERHILSSSVHYFTVDNFWGRNRTGEKRGDLYERLSLAYCGCSAVHA
jgi:hypothetical protein